MKALLANLDAAGAALAVARGRYERAEQDNTRASQSANSALGEDGGGPGGAGGPGGSGAGPTVVW